MDEVPPARTAELLEIELLPALPVDRIEPSAATYGRTRPEVVTADERLAGAEWRAPEHQPAFEP